jgi:hypothetical protein
MASKSTQCPIAAKTPARTMKSKELKKYFELNKSDRPGQANPRKPTRAIPTMKRRICLDGYPRFVSHLMHRTRPTNDNDVKSE